MNDKLKILFFYSILGTGIFIFSLMFAKADPLNLWQDSGSNIYYTAGNVGIGTTTPLGKLQINTGADTTNGLIVKGNSSQSASLQQWRDSTNKVMLSVDNLGQIVFNENAGGTDIADVVISVPGASLASNINIGRNNSILGAYSFAIGEQNATIGSSLGSGSFAFGYGNIVTNNFGNGTFSSAIGYNNQVLGDGGGAYGNRNIVNGNNSYILGTGITSNSSNSITIGTSDSYKVTIDGSGNVGIGTTSPAQKLSVNGNIYTNSGLCLKDVCISDWTSLGLSTSSPTVNNDDIGYITYISTPTGGIYYIPFLYYIFVLTGFSFTILFVFFCYFLLYYKK